MAEKCREQRGRGMIFGLILLSFAIFCFTDPTYTSVFPGVLQWRGRGTAAAAIGSEAVCEAVFVLQGRRRLQRVELLVPRSIAVVEVATVLLHIFRVVVFR